MMAIITAIARVIGIGGILFIALLLYEEGIPGANRIPFLPSIPIVGDLIAGRVHTHAAQQVKLATANMVTTFERDTLASKLGEMERQRNAASQALEDHRKRLEASQAAEQAAKDTLENEIANYERSLAQSNRACTLSSDDKRWLLDH